MEPIQKINALLKSNIIDLGSAKENGHKVIGYMPGGYFPEELALAAGMIPVCMIKGGDHSFVEAAMAYSDRWLDTFYRAHIGGGISGDDPYYRIIDALVFPVTDNNSRSLYDHLAYHTDIKIFPFGVPHIKDETGYRYFLHGITKIKGALEKIVEREIPEQRLKEAIQLCNQERRLLREISLMRCNNPSIINAKDFVMLNHAAMLIDKTNLIEGLTNIYNELHEKAKISSEKPKILLTGSTLAMGDDKIIDLIEDAGGQVVIEEFAEGIKPYWISVKTNGNAIASLAEAYFWDRIVPAWFRPSSEHLDNLIRLSKKYSVDGVIWYQLMYRESYKIESHFFPEMLKRETGLSMLTLESDYEPSEVGQLRTRIEAFIESIRRQ